MSDRQEIERLRHRIWAGLGAPDAQAEPNATIVLAFDEWLGTDWACRTFVAVSERVLRERGLSVKQREPKAVVRLVAFAKATDYGTAAAIARHLSEQGQPAPLVTLGETSQRTAESLRREAAQLESKARQLRERASEADALEWEML